MISLRRATARGRQGRSCESELKARAVTESKNILEHLPPPATHVHHAHTAIRHTAAHTHVRTRVLQHATQGTQKQKSPTVSLRA
jgi:hypothetical protein